MIEVKDLIKIFGQQPEKALSLLEQGWSKKRIFTETKLTVGVNRASFTVKEGEIFVIMGLSGSGKSTLIRLLNRLIEPTGGSISFQGENIVEMSEDRLREFRRTSMSMVFQKFALFPHRTIAQNVEFGLEVQKIPAKIRREKAREALALVGLEEWENSYPDQLSGGMQQRVGLARALANSPQVLLMDEAFSALDPLIRKDMQEELRELQEKLKKTIVFITHDLNEALRIGDRIALMKDGSIVQIGTPEEIMISPANEYVERFIEDVDLSRVLTASHVMRRPETMVYDRGGPRVALELMRENGISNLFVVDNAKRLIGVLTAEDAARAIKENKGLDDIIIREVPTVTGDTLLNDLFELVSVSRVPVAVTSESGRLLGVIIRGAVLGALAGNHDRVRKAVSEDGA
ncbi:MULTISPECIES: glycine betaine/L-proline ABC transporter ATP-binding protein [unclassified Paenibacillus]|uniref:quaternary amine ABC transporter ATP-binding protein n=1 Tax=unclassified Paenibacillus TaxID=185978 RepID=UPI001AE36001|nr:MULTISPECIES: glycine betaine/L-proline ABC transporter ATP-binding protein [unclassified Paenibacillus]MBP1156725.1 glycine betaine/proline transport system ATP-binding protein [Paenibacillus sp. PvP091]MBP1172537.1 glycine betaine/proline transport system ATP-binding protein [Paenibacillus sp. PvR098]MBP2438917.1 glycine betaine/proline transport system ATP-binding protein [Paenibacillus sp. PvP052]